MNAQITFKTDANLKQEFSAFVSELGMSVSAALNLLMKNCLRNNEMDSELFVKKNPREGWREDAIRAHKNGDDKIWDDTLDDCDGEWQWPER